MKQVGLRFQKFSRYLFKIGIVSAILYFIGLIFPIYELVNLFLKVLSLSSFGESILLKGMSKVMLSIYKEGE